MFCLDLAGTVISTNDAAAERFGRGSGGLLGRPFLDRVHPEDRKRFEERLELCRAERGWRDWVFRATAEPEDTLPLLVTAYATRDAAGRDVVLLVGREVSEPLEGQLSESSLQLLALSATCKECVENFATACAYCRRETGLELTLAEDRERRRIAGDLHDGLGQGLVSVQLKLGALQEDVPDALAGRVKEVRDLLRDALRAARSLTFEVSNPLLYEVGLEAALRSVGERLAADYGLSVEIEADAATPALAEGVRIVLYRVLSELMVNVARHARAETLKVTIRSNGKDLTAVVKDDGIGFAEPGPNETEPDSSGMGLFLARRRLKRIGGRLEIMQRDHRGTKAVVDVPVS